MIQLTRLNHVPLVLNSDLIEHVEVTPDTVVTLTTGQKIVVVGQTAINRSSTGTFTDIVAFRNKFNVGATNLQTTLVKGHPNPGVGNPSQPGAVDPHPGAVDPKSGSFMVSPSSRRFVCTVCGRSRSAADLS